MTISIHPLDRSRIPARAAQPLGAQLWRVGFKTARPMKSFPQVLLIKAERQADPAYRREGRFRSTERHCLFKLTLAGEGCFQCGRKRYALPAGHGFLCEVRDPAISYYFPTRARSPWDFVFLSFTGPAAVAMTRDFIRQYGPVYQLPTDLGFVQDLTAWRQYDGKEILLSPAAGARIVAALFSALSAGRSQADGTNPGFALIRETQRLMQSRLRQFCNVKSLADELGISREHLCRAFKKQTGQSPYQYLLRQKMIEACRLLKETRLPQKEIAGQLGYAVPAHFTRTFTRVIHLAPRRFRQVGSIPVH